MKKSWVAFSLLLLFSACSRQNEEVQTKEDTGKELKLYFSRNSISALSKDSLLVYDIKKDATVGSMMTHNLYKFAPGESIFLQKLEPTEHTIFALANLKEEAFYPIRFNDLNTICINSRSDEPLQEIFGGIVKADATSDTATMQMVRLVGGLTINITNLDTVKMQNIHAEITNISGINTIGETTITMEGFRPHLTIGAMNYFLPTAGPARGLITMYMAGEEITFEFTTKNAVEANKKLELNLTLSIDSKARSAQPCVVCTEKISDL